MTSRLFPLLWLFCFIAALLPFAAYEAQSVLLAVTALAAALSFCILKAPLPHIAAPVDVTFLAVVFAFWTVAFVSVVNSEIPYTSFIYFCFFSAFPLSLCCTITAPNKERFFAMAGYGLWAVFAALGLASMLQFFLVPEALIFGRVHWPFADPNSLGGLMALGFFGGFGLMTGARTRLQSNLGLVLAILAAGALLVSGSRGALIGVLAGLFVFSALAMPQLRKHTRCLVIFVLAAGALFWMVNFAAPPVAENAGQRIGETLTGAEPVLWTRPAIWEGTQRIIDRHYWTGTGIGTFYLYYPEVRLEGDPRSAGRMAHSDPLQFHAEMGGLAPALFYMFMLLGLVLTVRALMNLPPGDDRRVHILAPFCGLMALVLHTHITFHFYILSILMAAGIVTGFWYWRVRAAIDDRFWRVPPLSLPGREALKIILIVPLLAGAYGFAMLQGSHILLARGEAKLQLGDIDGFARDVNAADRMALRKNAQAFITAAQVKLATLHAMGGIPDPGAAEIYESGLQQLAVAWTLNPRSAVIPYLKAEYMRAAALLGFEGRGDPEEFYQEALALNPAFFPPRIGLAEFYLVRNKNVNAYQTLEEGVKWRFAARVPLPYYELLARLALEAGDDENRNLALDVLLKTQGKTSANP